MIQLYASAISSIPTSIPKTIERKIYIYTNGVVCSQTASKQSQAL